MAADMQKNMRATFLTKIPISILAFLHSVIITRLLGPEGFGVFQYITTNVQFLVMAVAFNMTHGVLYFSASKRIDESKIVSLVLLLFLGSFTVMNLLVLAAPKSSWIALWLLPKGFQDSPFAWYFLAAFAYHFAQIFMHAHLKGRKSFIRSNNVMLLSGVVNVLVSGLLYVMTTRGFNADLRVLFNILTALQIGLLVVVLIGYLPSARPRLNFNWTKSEFKTYFGYTSLGYGNMFSKFFNKRLDVYFVQYLSGSVSLGLYGVATTLTNFLLDFVQPLNQVIIPYLTTMNRDETVNTYPVYLRILTTIIIVPVIVLIAFASPIVNLIYGSAFSPAISALQVISIAIIFAYLRNYFSSYNNAKDRIRFNLLANVTALIVTIALDIVLIPKYGILGAAYATLAAYAISCFIVGRTVKKHLQISWASLLLPKTSDWDVLLKTIRGKR